MAALLNFLIIGLSTLLLVGGIVMAIWAWRKLSITVFAWILVVRLTQTLSSLPWAYGTDPAQHPRIDAALENLTANPALDPTDVFLLWCSVAAFFPLLSTASLFVLAAVETAKIATRLQPEWQPPSVVSMAHCLRHGFGLLAVLAVVVPTIALHLCSHSAHRENSEFMRSTAAELKAP
jgi:hypothetical protein